MARHRIGRKSDNDIVIRDTTVSRYHAELTDSGRGSYELRDLGSSQGTYVDSGRGWNKIDRADIDATTPIRFGNHKTTAAELLRVESDASRPGSGRDGRRAPGKPPAWAWPAVIGAAVLVVVIIAVVALLDRKPSRDQWLAACGASGKVSRERCLCSWDIFEPAMSAKELEELAELFRRDATPDAMSPALRSKWDALSPQVQSRCTGTGQRR